MIKNITGGSTISYGPALPDTSTAFDGTLFFKTGTDQGLYMFGFVQDTNSALVGDQSAQNWIQIQSPSLYVSKSGDVVNGPLSVLGVGAYSDPYGRVSVTMPSDSSSYGYFGLTRQGQVGWSIGVDTSNRLFFGTGAAGSQPNVTNRPLTIDASGGILVNGNPVWHAGNDGTGSGLDADLLDGRDSSFFTNASNISQGTLSLLRMPYTPIQQGGGTGQNANKMYIGWTGTSLFLEIEGANSSGNTVNFQNNWPINVQGSASTANYANTAGSANALNGRLPVDQLPLIIEPSRVIPSGSTAVSIDLQGGDYATIFEVRLTVATTTITFTNPPSTTGKGYTWTLLVTNDATAGRVLNFGNTIKWAGGQVPNRTTTANGVDLYTFFMLNGIIYGALSVLDAR